MDVVSISELFGGSLFAGILFLLGFVQVGWHVAVIVFLYKIWRKVKHLPAG
jgi:hypothetical protein